MDKKVAIHWFRQDLRLADNPALNYASDYNVLPIYIHDNANNKNFELGSTSKWWLYNSLNNLNKNLSNSLNIYIGNPADILEKLIKKYNVSLVTWNRCYEPWAIQRDKKIKRLLEQQDIEAYSDNGYLLWEPWEISKKDKTNYKVFTPFYKRGCLQALPPREPISKPKKLTLIKDSKVSCTTTSLGLLPKITWYKTIEDTWKVGEQEAIKKLKYFIKNSLPKYKEGRNFPALKNVSQLSPYLHFGEISPNQIWYMAKELHKSDDNLNTFISELCWREFSYNLLYYYPTLPRKNWRESFNKFPWCKNKRLLNAWKKGQTGYPIVDAGMRELWQTGYMHNRVRMVVASFLVKNLLIDWRCGEKWFWDCLVDADLAANSASWQWVAGSGADAAPYFRVFNPVTQGQKFDSDGKYTKKYLPELSKLPSRFLFNPFEAPKDILDKAGVVLGDNYPYPIVDLKESRNAALKAYELTKF